MIIWTTQPLNALTQLDTTGFYRCSREKSWNLTKENDLRPAYQWLAQKMTEKIGPPPEGVEYPVWAWHTWAFERRAPDTESAAFLRRTEDKVLLMLDIQPERLLLTDFDAWQLVMLNSYVPDVRTDEEYSVLEERLQSLSDQALREETEHSWDRVFLTDRVDTPELTRGKFIQATFWEIRKADVISAQPLTASAI